MSDLHRLPVLSRREAFRLGALSVLGYGLAPLVEPSRVRADSNVTPRGSAESVIFINLRGGPSQMDTFDAKMAKWTPEDFDIRRASNGALWPHGLLPKLAERLGDVTLVRSMEAWDSVHSRAQFYLQTGHQSSPARNDEMPSVGSVIAYEMRDRGKDSDFLPPFVSMNYDAKTMYGPLQKEGCLTADMAPLTLDLNRKSLPFLLQEENRSTFERRWELLSRLDGPRGRLQAPETQKVYREFASYAEGVRRMMLEPRMSEVFEISAEDHKRYGEHPFGDACALARNMVSADAGARFLMVTHGDWDHHSNLHAGLRKRCPELDAGLSALLEDLASIRRPDGSTQLSHTLVVAVGEFGRTPGELTTLKGREHYEDAMCALFAGAGVLGGQVLGRTDDEAAKVVDPQWSAGRSIYVEDLCATVYSALGIDWTKRVTGTPSGRDFVYVDPAAGNGYYRFQEISELYG
ncbi:MAG: DUF1501 domain-containing protein [Bryobacterales bacterium]